MNIQHPDIDTRFPLKEVQSAFAEHFNCKPNSLSFHTLWRYYTKGVTVPGDTEPVIMECKKEVHGGKLKIVLSYRMWSEFNKKIVERYQVIDKNNKDNYESGVPMATHAK